MESVHINGHGVSVLSGSCYLSKKHEKKHLLLEQNTKIIKQDISIDKFNISNLPKAVISRAKTTEALKNHSSL